jgi:hypothetical protein
VRSAPALLKAADKQLETVLASGSAGAFLGWWMAWKIQDGISRDDLVDLVTKAGAKGLVPE